MGSPTADGTMEAGTPDPTRPLSLQGVREDR
jgi:hypothetical protein